MKKKKQIRHHYYLLHYGGSDSGLPPTVVSVYRSLFDNARSWCVRLRSIGSHTSFEPIPCSRAYMLMRHGFEVQPFYKVKEYLLHIVKLYDTPTEQEETPVHDFENYFIPF